MMMTKYETMHQQIFGLCKEKQISVYPGRISCLEYRENHSYRVAKHFFVADADLGLLHQHLRVALDEACYRVKLLKSKEGYRSLTVTRKDILATSYMQIMKYPKGTYHPTFTFRGLVEDNGVYRVRLQQEVRSVAKDLLMDTRSVAYGGGELAFPKAIDTYYYSLYEKAMEQDTSVSAYQIFEESVSLETLIAEAEARGLLTDTTKDRYDTYRQWTKEEKAPVMKAYHQYERELLEMKLP